MTLFKNKFKIDSNRLRNWDYSNEAIYFITIATKNRECIFGSIEKGKMILNDNGQIVENALLKSIKIRKNWFFHNWVVMPNHIHLLIEIQNDHCSDSNVETHNVEMHSSASTHRTSTNVKTIVEKMHCCASLQKNQSESKLSRKPNSISSFAAIFKSVTTKQINDVESIRQSNYHDHIVRNYKTKFINT
ncbi:transposase [Flavobacterium piscis]|uniref:REP element-mobilizing transposase RayT n=1 Tax=Flavobacterium piscis TaxID=1114874 RepID=A0ABU1Y9C0_9FLAO|nr:transposase [Flavobacterium piscis]MDR7210819.1 REP element-mobilizing transposase RayT [Flavobacterium piscis]